MTATTSYTVTCPDWCVAEHDRRVPVHRNGAVQFGEHWVSMGQEADGPVTITLDLNGSGDIGVQDARDLLDALPRLIALAEASPRAVMNDA